MIPDVTVRLRFVLQLVFGPIGGLLLPIGIYQHLLAKPVELV